MCRTAGPRQAGKYMCDPGGSASQSWAPLVSRHRRRRRHAGSEGAERSRLRTSAVEGRVGVGGGGASCDWELPLRPSDSPPYLELSLCAADSSSGPLLFDWRSPTHASCLFDSLVVLRTTPKRTFKGSLLLLSNDVFATQHVPCG